VDLETLARRTPGFTGADLANLVNEAALLAARKGLSQVGVKEMEEAVDRIVAGLEKRTRVLNEKEKKTVAYHETGHALVAAFRSTAEKVHKITIVPRSIGALGFTMQLPTEDRYLMSKQELLEKIDVTLGGRAAEEVVFNEITTGAQNDIQRATEVARSMITLYGMNEKLGNVAYQKTPNPFLQAQGVPNQAEFSEETARMIDYEVRAIIESRMAEVLALIKNKEKLLREIAGRLLEKETIEAEEFEEIIARESDRKAQVQ
jgi:cell division protease FtsH